MDLEFLPPANAPQEQEDIRVLTPDEIATLKPIFDEAGSPLPDPAMSCIVGCVQAGRVVAFLVLQLKLHAEPMWIEDGKSHLFKRLVSTAENVIITRTGPQWVYLFCPAGRVAQMAQSVGMQVEPYVVLSKLVQPQAPGRVELPLPLFDKDTDTEVVH